MYFETSFLYLSGLLGSGTALHLALRNFAPEEFYQVKLLRTPRVFPIRKAHLFANGLWASPINSYSLKMPMLNALSFF